MEDSTLLHRQVNPVFIQNGIVSLKVFLTDTDISSSAFTPSKKDKKMLSVYNGDVFTAEKSFEHYNTSLESSGVLSVSAGECNTIDKIEVITDDVPFKGHASIDFTKVESNNKIKEKGRRLRNLAVARGWTFTP